MSAEREQRFSQLFRAQMSAVRGYTRTLVVETDVDDIVSATFRTAWQRLDDIPPLSVRPWLFGVARNHVLNHVRAERRRKALVDVLGTIQPPSHAELHHGQIDPARIGTLRSALDQLSDSEREIIQLAAWHELMSAEIATVLDIRPNAARVRLHRARQHLSDLVDAAEAKAVQDA